MLRRSVRSSKYSPAAAWACAASSYSPFIKGLEKTVPLWHVVSRGVSLCPADMLHTDVPKAVLRPDCFASQVSATEAELRPTRSQTPSERRLALICFQCIYGRPWCRDVISSHTKGFAMQETGWLSAAVWSQPMKVQRERGPVEQVCNLCVIWHCAPTPILCSRRWAVLREDIGGGKWINLHF